MAIDELRGIPLEHRRVTLDEVTLHCVVAGQGPLVVLLHGFPEFWYAWRHQIPALVRAGFQVVAPDMRGYNTSDKPKGVDSYRGGLLSGDIAQLIEALGHERAHVAGHDWGGVVAWLLAMHHPDRVDRLAILNVPHPRVMKEGLHTIEQLTRSWYVLFFQAPKIAEATLSMADFAALRHILRDDPVSPDAFSEEEIQRYVEAAAQPGALTAAINYYRAAARHRLTDDVPIDHEVMVIWGMQDRYLLPELAEPPALLVPHCQLHRFNDSSHWIQSDAPGRVNALLTGFFQD